MSVQPVTDIVRPEWTFADRIRKARSIAGMDQRVFAAAIGVTHPALGAWESGRGKPRDIVAVAKRVELLTRVPAAWLLGVEDEKAPRGDGPEGQGRPGAGVGPKGLSNLYKSATSNVVEFRPGPCPVSPAEYGERAA